MQRQRRHKLVVSILTGNVVAKVPIASLREDGKRQSQTVAAQLQRAVAGRLETVSSPVGPALTFNRSAAAGRQPPWSTSAADNTQMACLRARQRPVSQQCRSYIENYAREIVFPKNKPLKFAPFEKY